MSKGFDKFLECLNKYLEMMDISLDGSRVKVFGSATLQNGAIIRAINNFHNRPWFSNVAINMDSDELFDYQTDSGICYAQVNIIFII